MYFTNIVVIGVTSTTIATTNALALEVGNLQSKLPIPAANAMVNLEIRSIGLLYAPFVAQMDSGVIPGCRWLHEPTLTNILTLSPHLNDVISLLSLYSAINASHANFFGEKTPRRTLQGPQLLQQP